MNSSSFDALAISRMASGHLCLSLSEHVSWEAFPNFANLLLSGLGGRVKERLDGPEIRLWQVEFGSSAVRLVFDDYPLMVSLESSDTQGDSLLIKFHRDLSQ